MWTFKISRHFFFQTYEEITWFSVDFPTYVFIEKNQKNNHLQCTIPTINLVGTIFGQYVLLLGGNSKNY